MTRTMAESHTALLALAHELADAAGRVVLPYFRRRLTVHNKARDGSFDPVTAADRAAERVIGKMLSERVPDHGMVGEEFGNRNAGAMFKWVIDPIDGTRSFVTGSPLWGTLIGLMRNDEPYLGLIDQPYTRERLWSGPKASFIREATGRTRRIRCRPCSALTDAVFMTTHPDNFVRGAEEEGYLRVKRKARMTRYGGDCYSYCLLAAGFVDLVIESGLKPYDVLALIPVVEKAGGVMTAWDGGTAAEGGRIIAAGDPRLHEAVIKLLNR